MWRRFLGAKKTSALIEHNYDPTERFFTSGMPKCGGKTDHNYDSIVTLADLREPLMEELSSSAELTRIFGEELAGNFIISSSECRVFHDSDYPVEKRAEWLVDQLLKQDMTYVCFTAIWNEVQRKFQEYRKDNNHLVDRLPRCTSACSPCCTKPSAHMEWPQHQFLRNASAINRELASNAIALAAILQELHDQKLLTDFETRQCFAIPHTSGRAARLMYILLEKAEDDEKLTSNLQDAITGLYERCETVRNIATIMANLPKQPKDEKGLILTGHTEWSLFALQKYRVELIEALAVSYSCATFLVKQMENTGFLGDSESEVILTSSVPAHIARRCIDLIFEKCDDGSLGFIALLAGDHETQCHVPDSVPEDLERRKRILLNAENAILECSRRFPHLNGILCKISDDS